jgi:predicted membrane protein
MKDIIKMRLKGMFWVSLAGIVIGSGISWMIDWHSWRPIIFSIATSVLLYLAINRSCNIKKKNNDSFFWDTVFTGMFTMFWVNMLGWFCYVGYIKGFSIIVFLISILAGIGIMIFQGKTVNV